MSLIKRRWLRWTLRSVLLVVVLGTVAFFVFAPGFLERRMNEVVDVDRRSTGGRWSTRSST